MSNITPVFYEIKKENYNVAAEWASKKLNYSIDRPNMNTRGVSEAVDDKIMGDIATIALVEFIKSQGLQAIAYDQIRTDNFEMADPGWDIFVGLSGLNHWAKTTTSPQSPPPNLGFTISVRSSRLVKDEDVNIAINTRDFKIFAKNANITDDLSADIETQVYYGKGVTQLNNLKTTDLTIKNCTENRTDCQKLVHDLKISTRFNTCILTSWNFSHKISAISNSLNRQKRTWSSFGKLMWFAPLRNGYSFHDFKRCIQENLEEI
jgi:hypothetical protein